VSDPDIVSRAYARTYAVRMHGYTVDPSPSRREAEARHVRYQDTVPTAELVTRLSVEGEWVPADQEPVLPTVPPRRGDAVEAWLKAQRDRWNRHGDSSEFWHEFDSILDEYRLHADTGTPLDQHACENGTVDDCHGCYQETQQ
jgi:hypothetical protein